MLRIAGDSLALSAAPESSAKTQIGDALRR